MKKPIDPNLNSTDSEDLLFGAYDKTQEPVQSKNTNGTADNNMPELKAIVEKEMHHSNGEYHRSHSSSGEHHSHSSSGEHHRSHSSSSGHHHSHSSSSGHHHHSSKHHHSSRKHKKKMKKSAKVTLIILLVIAFIVSSVGGVFAVLKSQGKTDFTSASITDKNHEEIITYKGHKYAFNENVVSIAFMGIDQRDMQSKNDADFVGCADADVVVAVDTSDGTISVINVPRDTMVDIDIYNENGVFLNTENIQLCLAYAYGDGKTKSCENVTKSISRILYDVPISKYFALNLEGVAPINDAIGGVTLEAKYSIPSQNIIEGQTVTLKGDMAEAYVRTRDMDYLEASLNRSQRIEQYVKAFATQLLPAVKKDFGVVSKLYNTASQYSQTNLSLNNATYLASFVLSKGINSFKTYTISGEMKAVEHTKYPDAVIAEFTPNEDSVMEAVLNTYYTQID